MAAEPLHSPESQTKDTKSEVAVSPLPSQVPKKGRNCYITTTFSGVPNKGEKGLKVREQLLSNAYILGGLQKRGQDRRWLPDPCLVGGANEGGVAM